MAENEVILLKVLNGPTIIKCYDSFSEPNKVITIMEYAEQGSLAKLIETRRIQGQNFSNKEVTKTQIELGDIKYIIREKLDRIF